MTNRFMCRGCETLLKFNLSQPMEWHYSWGSVLIPDRSLLATSKTDMRMPKSDDKIIQMIETRQI